MTKELFNLDRYSRVYDSVFNKDIISISKCLLSDKLDLYVSSIKNPTSSQSKIIYILRNKVELLFNVEFDEGSLYKGEEKHLPLKFNPGDISVCILFGREIKLNSYNKVYKIPSGSVYTHHHSKDSYKKNFVSSDKCLFILQFTKTSKHNTKHVYSNIMNRIYNRERISFELNTLYKNKSLRNTGTLQSQLKMYKVLGRGDWGIVYSASFKERDKSSFALKMSKLSKEDYNDPYSIYRLAWFETHILKGILTPIIESSKCPNLPLLIDTFVLQNSKLKLRKSNLNNPCVVNVLEIANGDLLKYFSYTNLSIYDIMSSLFQVMTAVHAIQMYGQLSNNDIKASNILYYNVKPGGYWHYSICGRDFYIENRGKLFILNDFGVSNIYNPSFKLYPTPETKKFNLGSRFAINMNGVFSPIRSDYEFSKDIEWLNGSDSYCVKCCRSTSDVKNNIERKLLLSKEQEDFLFDMNISYDTTSVDFFSNPYIIPPFEFMNDTQDVLRMYLGGKRTTQNGNHKFHKNIYDKINKLLKPWASETTNSSEYKYSLKSHHVLAGDFIKEFFTKSYNMTKIPTGVKIDTFIL